MSLFFAVELTIITIAGKRACSAQMGRPNLGMLLASLAWP